MKDSKNTQKNEELQRLILQAKQGDADAFEEVYTLYYTPLFRYILARSKDKNLAEDLTQVVFLKMWTALPTWNEKHTSPLSFLFTVARNTLVDHFRKKSSKEIISDEIVFEKSDAQEYIPPRNESVEFLTQQVAMLSDEQQEIIRLYYQEDLTYKEISEVLQKREDAIRQLHSRALKRLRELCTQYYD